MNGRVSDDTIPMLVASVQTLNQSVLDLHRKVDETAERAARTEQKLTKHADEEDGELARLRKALIERNERTDEMYDVLVSAKVTLRIIKWVSITVASIAGAWVFLKTHFHIGIK